MDDEPAEAVAPELCETIFRRDEWAVLSAGFTVSRHAATVCFSAKEAVFKAYYPCARTFLEFHDLRFEVDWRRMAFVATLTSGQAGVGRSPWLFRSVSRGVA